MAGAYELVYVGTCKPPIGRPFGGPLDPQFPVGTTFPLEVGRKMAMGRAKEAAIFVDSMIVARHHAAITLEADGALRIANLGGGGVFVGGAYVKDETRIVADQRFELGGQLAFAFRRAVPPMSEM